MTFEQALFKLYTAGKINKEEALANSDSPTNLSWLINNAEQRAQDRGAESPTGRIIIKPNADFKDITLNTELLDKPDT